ncbi:MAG: SurA N-terminal domain-containing protein [Bacteroidota bacterium]|nr:SurA N-terminal domain-containing protein [Bacteroidota bacterium]MDX5431103.1 SurA N-terminal domain-containing protein [Bacteroidota bacterium]MDX5469853.1 SurA N-terminal domain-containing protein [Bacteroidota bacterium]
MAVIEKIRQRSGLLIGIIGLALLSFLISDAINNNMGLFRGQDNTVGVIDGKTITYEEFSKKTQTIADNLEQQGQPVNEFTQNMIREQVWNDYFQTLVIDRQYEELGLMVTDQELFATVTNPVDFPQIRDAQMFKNQQTQQFDPALVITYLKQLDQDPSGAAKKQWVDYEEKNLKPQIIQKKYNTLLTKAVYKTTLEVKAEMESNLVSVDAKIIGYNFNSIMDDSVSVTEDEMRTYLANHEADYQQEASRRLEYVLFEIFPSSEDTASALNWVSGKKESFQNAKNDTTFITNYSEIGFDTTFKPRGTFPEDIEPSIFNANEGDVIGPHYSDGKFSLYKVLKFQDDTVPYIRASQILIKPRGGYEKEDSLKAVTRANAIADALRKGADFTQMAKDSSQDFRTASKGGDLGWVKKGSGALQEVIERSLYNTPEGGIIVVRTSGGVHIVKVTGAKTYRTAMVGQIGRTVTFSSETENKVYDEAFKFAAGSRDGSAFSDNAEAAGYIKRISPDLKEGEATIPNIENAREIVRWAFNADRDLGDVSDVIGVDNKYVVAQLVDIKKEGTAKLEDVRDRLENDTRIAKKAEMLKERLKTVMNKDKSIEQMALELGIIVNNAPNTVFSNHNLPFVGNDPALVGAIMGAKENALVGPIETKNGVYILVVTARRDPGYQGDLKADQNRMINENGTQVANRAFEALKKMADMKDYRYKFF